MNDPTHPPRNDNSETIEFVHHFASSEQFLRFFREGMGLVEQTADYLDGEGRKDVACLNRNVSMLYASESMRLTTRLMQIASWLLLQRAVNEGEMTREQAADENRKVSLDTLPPNTDDIGYLDLPDGLVRLIDKSLAFQRRVKRLDALLYGPVKPRLKENGVHGQVSQLTQVFGQT